MRIAVASIVRQPGPPTVERVPMERRRITIINHVALVEIYHQLWSELHAKKQEATPEWMASWVAKVPSVGCGCKRWLAEYLQSNPPRYGDFAAWANELHLAVSCKLGKPGWSVRTFGNLSSNFAPPVE